MNLISMLEKSKENTLLIHYCMNITQKIHSLFLVVESEVLIKGGIIK